ncbi:Ubiquitin carboxyl-terminal hydrolase 25 [Labeo rohita]|uniref:Ubiquitin carboxyl-terminal hydrolase 25 n=1 Tax=Labeo rohita TaxID=84645 RepID=A0ABQ8LL12_LABRO|nr:Ubiquitin carboxyl-terminal hydrolase 25 [Labeo rohita]
MITRFSPVSSYKLPQEDSFPFLDGLPSARTTIPSACSCERLSRSALVWVCVRGAYGVVIAMRVEQDFEHGETSENSSQMLLNQLREITGIQDLQVLQSALNASQGDISHAIGLLTTQPPEEEHTPEEPANANNERNTSNTQNGPAKDDLQTAIELSLQEALEVSAEENAARMKRKRCEGSGESCSPADWIRQEDCPVGIRNVGNTCWFSAVIQELRCLFALMVGSNRRFVDPSAAVELLRDAFRTSEAQQDVSEFTHKLLDWLEDAFQLAANGNNPEDKQNNPMVQLFYGTFVAERLHEGKIVSNIEQFGQYPLQVNGFNNLDECLEGAMVEGEIESLHSDQTVSSGQERWFSKLPPVLTFELSRFEFNQSLGRPEKIHKKLEFPQVIYMDRYLHKNVDQTHGRRGEVKRLKDQLTVLQQKLEGYKNYGSGPTKYPLADMLQYVLEFATTKPTNASPASVPANPSVHTEPSSEPDDAGSSDGSGSPQTATQRTPIHKPFTQCRPPMEVPLQPAPHSVTEEELYFVRSCLQRWRAEVENTINELKASIDKVSQALEGMYSDNSLCQVPYRLHAVLVHEGQASAGHYWAYIYDHANKRWLKYNDVMVTESTWEELVRDSYGGMTNASAYCLMYINDKLPYLIAEDTDDETGQALKGMDSLPSILRRYVREDNRWFQQELKEWEEQFCQAQREEAQVQTPTEKPVQEEPQNPEQVPNPEPEHEQTNEVAAEPPTDLSPAPAQDSEEPVANSEALDSVSTEPSENVEEGGEEPITSSQTPGPPDEEKPDQSQPVVESATIDRSESEVEVEEQVMSDEGGAEAEPEAQAEPEASSTEENQAAAARSQPENEVSEVEIPNVGKILAFHEEFSRLYELSQEETTPQQDPRLQHVLVYFFQNQAPNRVIERTLLEQFADRNLSFDDRIREALNYLAHAHQDNSVLLRKGEKKGVDQSLIALYRRKCLKELNENAATLFKSQDENDVAEAVTIMNECIIPCMHLMVRDSVSQEDLDIIELIRSCWCSYLGQDMDDSLQEKLSEFLPRVLDCSAEMVVLKEPPKVRNSPHDLCSRLSAVMESIHSTSVVTVK